MYYTRTPTQVSFVKFLTPMGELFTFIVWISYRYNAITFSDVSHRQEHTGTPKHASAEVGVFNMPTL